MTDLLALSVLALLLLVLLLVQALRPRRILRSVERESVRSGLSLTPEVLPLLLQRRRATGVGSAVGSAVGFEAGVLALMAVHLLHHGLAGSLLQQSSWLIGGGFGTAIGAAIGARVVRPQGKRVARDRAVSIRDYIDPAERRVTLGLAVVAVAVAAIPLLRGSTPVDRMDAAAAGLVPVVAVAAAELAARIIVSRPQPTGSTHALAWGDAIRSSTVRTLVHVAGAAALYSLVVSVPAAARALGGGTGRSPLQLDVVLVVSAIVLLGVIWTMRQRPTRYFLRRLWPVTAAELADHEQPMGARP